MILNLKIYPPPPPPAYIVPTGKPLGIPKHKKHPLPPNPLIPPRKHLSKNIYVGSLWTTGYQGLNIHMVMREEEWGEDVLVMVAVIGEGGDSKLVTTTETQRRQQHPTTISAFSNALMIRGMALGS